MINLQNVITVDNLTRQDQVDHVLIQVYVNQNQISVLNKSEQK